MAFELIDIYLWQKQVFNYRIAKGYLTFKQLANFEVFSGEYQREIEQEHEEKIIQYLKNEKYRYLPDIVIVVRDKELQFVEWRKSGNIFINQSLGIRISQRKDRLAKLQVRETSKKDEMLQKFKIVDGNHRLSAIKKLLESEESSFGNEIIGVTFILSNEDNIKNELAFFYYLNSKSKPLLPKDYLSKTLQEFQDSKELKSIDWWLYVFRECNDKILDIFKDYRDKLEKDIIAKACDYLAKKIKNEELLNNFFAFLRDSVKQDKFTEILKNFYCHSQLAEFICIVFFLYEKMKEGKAIELENEIKYFCEWLLEDAKLEKFQDFENLFLVYQNTYIPKSFKIFIAMEFKDNDDVDKAIRGAIKEVSRNLGDEKLLEPLRIDKHIKGTTYQIIDEIFNQIDEKGLVIADITGKNPNVYLEVGYTLALCRAKGIDNQLILLLKDNKEVEVKEKVSFDLQGYKWIPYKNTEELREKLEVELKEYYKTKYIPKFPK
ncbi:DNA sulfur modification protein DndB [Helicobacter sp. UBA3407]|uniref:DNA sulfur modification protein DndB n=1 Tax=Helicobacter sp. UBA3407 TaxID=1946588 RepID=UPI0026115E4A|nr:DNA sulfur modification protein DndB [Helicobacter sp. UBA3407]